MGICRRGFIVLGLKNNALVVGAKRNSVGFYERIIEHVFRPMTLGRLTMLLPDSSSYIFGEGGAGPEAFMRVTDQDFFRKCVLYGDVGFGESFVDGNWESDDVAKVIEWMIVNVENNPVLMAEKPKHSPVNFLKLFNKIQHALKANTKKGSRKNISDHYDLGNNFFRLFLDPTMAYSSAYFRNSKETLEQAQINKFDMLCQKLKINASDHVLEIGGGWGGFAVHAVRNYGCRITTITISREQYDYMSGMVKKVGLEDFIEVKFMDYREVKGKFDKIVSVEMIEAVGHKFLKKFCLQCHGLLKKDGLLGLQMILSPDHRYDSFRKNVDWIQKHIFPGSLLPSMQMIQQSLRQTGTLMLHDYEDMTPSYAQTLNIWRERFNHNIEAVRSLGFDDTFIRKWNYYKCYCEAAFRTRNISVVQAVFTRPNNRSL